MADAMSAKGHNRTHALKQTTPSKADFAQCPLFPQHRPLIGFSRKSANGMDRFVPSASRSQRAAPLSVLAPALAHPA
jgi:hypothetical protein